MYEDDYEDDGSNLVKTLRKQLKEQADRIKSLEKENTNLSGAVRTRSLADILKDKGAKPGLARYFPSDLEPTEESVSKWLAEDGELFGFTPAPVAEDDQDLAAARQVQDATSTGGVQNLNRLAAEEQYLNEADTPEQWTARINEIKAGQAPFQQ